MLRMGSVTPASLGEFPPRPCNSIVREFTVYVRAAGKAAPDSADPEERVEAALAERAREVCPFAAKLSNEVGPPQCLPGCPAPPCAVFVQWQAHIRPAPINWNYL